MSKNTIQSISDTTGYSVSTVSRVLSGKAEKSRISQKAVEIITAEAQRVNYTPNLLAQGLRTKKTHTIGLSIPGIGNPFFASLASEIIENLKRLGYHTVLADSREVEEDFQNSIQLFRARNVDGIIAVPVGIDSSVIDDISEIIPTILVDRAFPHTRLPYICTDNYEGGFMATDYLIKRGYRKILSIQGVPDSTASRERVRGFEEAISKHSECHVEKMVVGDAFSVENGYNQVMALWKSGKRFDAVFAYSSTILLGAIRAFNELGLKIPQDVAVISFDNNGFLDFLNPSVTRIEQPLVEIGKLAAEALVNMIDYADEKKTEKPIPVQALLSPNLVIRESC